MSEIYCNHDKECGDTALLTNPPQYTWECKKCGLKGKDIKPIYIFDIYSQKFLIKLLLLICSNN